jgi:type III secretory pathway component EscS
MSGDRGGGEAERPGLGLQDPRAVDILTAEHWSLLSHRALGYQEIFGRTTVFVATLTGAVVALALLAQATRFGRETLSVALLLIAVVLFIGLTTFVRSVAINYEDARWITGMNLLRQAYLRIVPELEPFFVAGHDPEADRKALAYGSRQRLAALANSLTTTSGLVAVLNSVLAGALASDVAALSGAGLSLDLPIGVAASLLSAGLHVWYAARFRRTHAPARRPAR